MVFIGNCKCVPYEYKSVCWGGGIESDQMLEWRYNTLMHNTGTKSYFSSIVVYGTRTKWYSEMFGFNGPNIAWYLFDDENF